MSDLFNKHIKKATARTKERLLEGIGKAKATQDEAFDLHALNLNKQAKACERLHKDLKTYADALKKLTEAEKALRESIRVAYEPEWPDREHVVALTNTLDIQSDELEKKVSDELTASVTTYVAQFADLKRKVEKRGRKLVDYDSAKNSFNSIKASSKKGDSDPKLTKAFTELQQTETLYKELNGELLEMLPATYDSRITFLVDTLQTLFNSQSLHQMECAKLHKQLVSQLDSLGNSMDSLRVPRPEPQAATPVRDDSPTRNSDSPTSAAPSTPPQVSPAARASHSDSKRASLAETPKRDVDEKCEANLYPKLAATPGKKVEESVEEKQKEKKEEKEGQKKEEKEKSTNPFDDSDDDGEVEKVEMPVEVSRQNRKMLYMVRATHDYKAVDSDELSFSAGDVIKVLESSSDDELDDGWQLGKKEDGAIGVFPENFTVKE